MAFDFIKHTVEYTIYSELNIKYIISTNLLSIPVKIYECYVPIIILISPIAYIPFHPVNDDNVCATTYTIA